MEFIWYIAAGLGVGFAIGMTGVGGGSLMTPLLLMFGFPVHIAIGTDLMYAGIAKSAGVFVHAKKGNVNWSIMTAMALGSLPSSLLTIWFLSYYETPENYHHLLTSGLGVMLALTAIVIIFRKKLTQKSLLTHITPDEKHGHAVSKPATKQLITVFICGLILGGLVTLTSVGAGALGTAMLMILFPYLSAKNIVGTDLAHAVPLTLVAGLGHVLLGNVDYFLLAALLVGSIPAIYLGSSIASRVSNNLLQPLLATLLMGFGIKYLFF
ncbi:sulfite exporter TauE/SafE family protein [Marinomonas agarivorans]|nr:sulfite exporter TauE/SafE family protein [Marinomonas agarivorans]